MSGSRQPEDVLGDDAELDFAGPALDRIGLGAKPFARRLAAASSARCPIPARRDPPAAMISSWRRLFSSVPAYFIMLGMAGCASPAFSWSMKRSLIAAKASASTSNAAISARSSGSSTGPDARLPSACSLAAKPHAADHLALVAEEIFGDVPALVHLADELVLGHLHVVEEGLAEGRIAADQQDRLGRDARGFPCRTAGS